MTDTIVLIIASALIVPGILMAFVPMLPALTYMFVIALVFGIYDGFSSLSVNETLILLAIVAVSFVIDHASGALGAKYGGAHTKSLLWGMLASFVGTFILPPLGTFIGLFLGVLLAEIYYKKTRSDAIRAAGSALVGVGIGVAVNVILAVAFTGIFIFFALG